MAEWNVLLSEQTPTSQSFSVDKQTKVLHEKSWDALAAQKLHFYAWLKLTIKNKGGEHGEIIINITLPNGDEQT